MSRTLILGACIATFVVLPMAAADDLIPPLPPINDDCTHQITGATVGFFTDIVQNSVFGDTALTYDTNHRAFGQFSGGSVVSSPVGNVYQYYIVNGYVDKADYCF